MRSWKICGRWVASVGAFWALAAAGCDDDDDDVIITPEPTPGFVPEITDLAEAKLLIEHNATDNDTGFQIFVDGEPWKQLIVAGADAQVLQVNARGPFVDFGLTEAFFETNEPTADEVPIDQVLARLPEGDYAFSATTIDGATIQEGQATLSHLIPAEPEIVAPAEDAVVDRTSLVVTWNPVTVSLTGVAISIVGYQVIVEQQDVEPVSANSLFRPELSMFVDAGTTSVTVPAEFLKSGVSYKVEVLALAENGNQTISELGFTTSTTR